ncbi:recombinase family protein [Kocuria palustris]|uniref:recombinase family protein n=1 Tax=Kocuria palustris TaxID=71999 RepID=UPI003D756CC3
MTVKLIGYARVSTADQNTDRQQADLRDAGVRSDDLYVDHGVSGVRTSRPALDAALNALEAEDTLVVTTLDRLGRNTTHMLGMADELQARGVNLRVLNLGGESVDTRTPTGRLLLTVMSGIAEMERAIKVERVRDSVVKRKAAGGDLGGRPERFTEDTMDVARRLLDEGVAAAKVARDLGMSRTTLYRRLRAG